MSGETYYPESMFDERLKTIRAELETLRRAYDNAVEVAVKYELERNDLKKKLDDAYLKRGGEGIGQVYGLTNCWRCKSLTNDYVFVGKTQLCPECFDSFPEGVESRAKESRDGQPQV